MLLCDGSIMFVAVFIAFNWQEKSIQEKCMYSVWMLSSDLSSVWIFFEYVVPMLIEGGC